MVLEDGLDNEEKDTLQFEIEEINCELEGLSKSVLFSDKVKRQLKGKSLRKTEDLRGSLFLTDSEVSMISESKSLIQGFDLAQQENYLIHETRTNEGKLV